MANKISPKLGITQSFVTIEIILELQYNKIIKL